MSGPFAEEARLIVGVGGDVAFLPVELRADGIGCPQCGTGLLLRPSFKRRTFDLHELMTEIEHHDCRVPDRGVESGPEARMADSH